MDAKLMERGETMVFNDKAMEDAQACLDLESRQRK